MHLQRLLGCCCFCCCFLTPTSADRPASPIEDMQQECYGRQRDLNIGIYVNVGKYRRREAPTSHLKCATKTSSPLGHFESVVSEYAIDTVNARADMLPNISLGFAIVDACWSDLDALADLLYLVPDTDSAAADDNRNIAATFHEDDVSVTCAGGGWKRFRKVVGVVGPGNSGESVMVGGLSTIFQMPLVLTYASSDVLSDKARFAYTMRVVTPDRFQAAALVDLLVRMDWTYASLIYEEGPYGEQGAKQVLHNVKKRGVCLAFHYMFPTVPGPEELEEVIGLLAAHMTARVIIAYMHHNNLMALAPYLELHQLVGHFIWVGCDIFGFPDPGDPVFGPHFDGAIHIDFLGKSDKAFRRHWQTVTPRTYPGNPFIRSAYEVAFQCKWDATVDSNRSCEQHQDQSLSGLNHIPQTGRESKHLDALNVYFHALHALITNKCPEAFTDKSKLQGCVTGRSLHKHMLKVHFQGLNGYIKFDEKGDFLGSYIFTQYQLSADTHPVIGSWDMQVHPSLKLTTSKLKWQHRAASAGLPSSLCSLPCAPTEYRIQRKLPCCWDCYQCRNNEILIGNRTGCEICAPLTWPDAPSLTRCLPIEPKRLEWRAPLVVAMGTVTAVGLVVCSAVAAVFAANSTNKAIKASSRELMAVILLGVTMAYLTVLGLLLRPSLTSCHLSRFGFSVSVSLIYAPLVVKTSRVYRIFSAGKKGTQRPALVGGTSQGVMTATLIGLQLGLYVISVILGPPVPILRQKVATEKYVESLCSLPLISLIPSLSLNLVLILTCAFCGYLTRKLPENFNESWYIFVSVATTAFLWLVFLPAYFTAFYADHQVVLLSSCLIFNGTVTLLCLYLPKIYCVYFLEGARQGHGQSHVTPGTSSLTPATGDTNVSK